MRHSNGTVSFAPRLPEGLTRLAFTLMIRGRRLRVDITHAAVTYLLADGEPLEILHHGVPVPLSDTKPQVQPVPAIAARPRPGQPPGREPAHRRASQEAT